MPKNDSSDRKIDLSPLNVDGMPKIDLNQYTGLWAIEERSAMGLFDLVQKTDLADHVRNSAGIPKLEMKIVQRSRSPLMKSKPGSSSTNGPSSPLMQIAVIEIRGEMTKRGSSFSSAASMVQIRQMMRAARQDPSIDAVMVIIDSPGGTVSGTADLGNEYKSLSAEKPTLTFAEDLMCSAAIWVGSQGREVWANADHSIVGSKGVFVGLYDSSEQAKMEGLKPVVIRTGDLKGAGFPGEAFTDDQRAMWQQMVDEANASFDQAMESRKLSNDAKAELSRGGVFTAKQAISMGLIDRIGSYDDALSRLAEMVPQGAKGKANMKDENTAASLNEMRQACPGANSDFLLSQLEKGASVDVAQSSWMRVLSAKLEEAEKKAEEAEEVSKALEASEKKVAELQNKLDEAEKKAKASEKELKDAKSSLEKFNRSSGYASLPNIGRRGDTGRPGKPVKAPNKDDDIDPDDDEDDDSDRENGSATERWEAAVDAQMKRTKCKRHQAVQRVIRSNPKLHDEYVSEQNELRQEQLVDQQSQAQLRRR